MRVNSFAAVQLCFRTREDADQLKRVSLTISWNNVIMYELLKVIVLKNMILP
jgi:hypothetical protein